MKQSKLALSIVFFLTITHFCYAQDKPLKVFICAGQSNMVGGRSIQSELPKKLQGEQKNLFFNGKIWVPLAPGVTERKGFGPELSFAQELSENLNSPIGIIKFSSGGTSLDKHWLPKNTKSLYLRLVKQVKAAQKSRSIEIIGMIWMQGERDSKDEAMAANYAKNFDTLINIARKDFMSPNMIFISGRVNPPKERYPYVDTVRKVQEKYKDSNYAFIDCDTLEKGTDNVHYNTNGIISMGNKFAESTLAIINKNK